MAERIPYKTRNISPPMKQSGLRQLSQDTSVLRKIRFGCFNNKRFIVLHNSFQWMDIALGITTSTDGDRVSSTGSKSKMADAVNRCVDMEAEIDEAVDTLVEKKKQVVNAIEQLENAQEYDLLHLRYIQGVDLLEIANRWGKEYTTVTTCHGRAKKNLEVILEREGLIK